MLVWERVDSCLPPQLVLMYKSLVVLKFGGWTSKVDNVLAQCPCFPYLDVDIPVPWKEVLAVLSWDHGLSYQLQMLQKLQMHCLNDLNDYYRPI